MYADTKADAVKKLREQKVYKSVKSMSERKMGEA